MELSRTEKTAFALKLKAMVDAAYIEEIQSSQNDLSYLGACKITTMVEVECENMIGTFPKIIKGACHLARAFRNPDKAKKKEDMRKGFALLMCAAGGLSIIWGIISMFSIWTIIGAVLAVHTPFLGPVMFVAGGALAAYGVYEAIAKETPEALSAKAHDVLIEAISNWADEDTAKAKDATAQAELKLKASSAEGKVAEGSTFWRTIIWPFTSAVDYVENGPEHQHRPVPFGQDGRTAKQKEPYREKAYKIVKTEINAKCDHGPSTSA
ncbi:MAG TPA: hypothetical protein VG347_04925 [Verrucomicrobiae bacterium]|nr:hypothetical protein [Verrucomicrobiae bacterium]